VADRIILLVLLLHNSYYTQPLDVAVFNSLAIVIS